MQDCAIFAHHTPSSHFMINNYSTASASKQSPLSINQQDKSFWTMRGIQSKQWLASDTQSMLKNSRRLCMFVFKSDSQNTVDFCNDLITWNEVSQGFLVASALKDTSYNLDHFQKGKVRWISIHNTVNMEERFLFSNIPTQRNSQRTKINV